MFILHTQNTFSPSNPSDTSMKMNLNALNISFNKSQLLEYAIDISHEMAYN